MNEEIRKELEKLGSSLAKKEPESAFEVPEGYFENMQNEVLQKIESTSNTGKQRSIVPRWLYAVAAVLVVVIAALFVVDLSGNKAPGFDKLSEDAVYAYLENELDNIPLPMLVAVENTLEPLPLSEEEASQLEDYLEGELDNLSLEELENLL